MSNFTPTTSRNGECPICGDTKGKCRTTNDNRGDLILCMSLVGTAFGEIIDGYKCLGDTSDGTWAKFIPDNSQEWSEERKGEWRRERELIRQSRQTEAKKRQQQAFDPQERHEQYTRLFGELSLNNEDRQDLIRRGFSNEEIKRCGFQSVNQWQKLQSQYSHLLPGVSIHGDSLLTQAGYLCPVRNADGLIVACQVRLRVVGEDEGRYRWLTSKTRKNPGGQTPHTYPEGEAELPLAIHLPTQPPAQTKVIPIGITEGVGVKPFLAAQRLDIPVIGAAGGQFASSPVTFKDSIEQLAKKLESLAFTNHKQTSAPYISSLPVELIIYPDAGDVKNPQVMQRWRRVFKLLEDWDYSVQVAWWHQTTKKDPDIDELTDFSIIQYITPSQFLQKASTGWLNWRKSRKLTPDFTINSRYFDWAIPEPDTHLGVNSGLGTGKSFWLIEELLKAYPDKGFIAIGYRNSTLLQFCAKANQAGHCFYHIQKDLVGQKEKILISDPQSKIAGCVDSLIHFQPSDFDGKILLLDEIESNVSHLLRSQTSVSFHRERIKELFTEALSRAALVISLDGHLRDQTLNYLQSLQKKPKQLVKIQNLYQGNRGQLEFYLGSETQNEDNLKKINKRDYSAIFEAITSNPNRIVVASDSQKQLEAIDKLLTQQGKKTLRLDSTTSNSKWAREFLTSPESYLKKHKIECLLYSPSAEAGLSIDVKNIDTESYFTDLYFLFVGVLSTNAQLQMLGRVRDPEAKKHVWCAQRGLNDSRVAETVSEGLKEQIIANLIEDAHLCLQDVDPEQRALELAKKLIQISDNPHSQQEIHLAAIRNHESQNLRECLLEGIKESGYEVTLTIGQKVDDQKLKQTKEEIINQKSQQICHAEVLTASQASEKARNFAQTLEDKYQVTRHRLVERLPGIEQKTKTITEPVAVNKQDNLDNNHQYEPGSVEEYFLGNGENHQEFLKRETSSENHIAQGLEVGHNPEDFLNKNSALCPGCDSEDNLDNNHQYDPGSVEEYFLGNGENHQEILTGKTSSENHTAQGLEVGHNPEDFLNKNSALCPGCDSDNNLDTQPEYGLTEVKTITREVPIFDADFVKQVKFKDRGLISRQEIRWLLNNPDSALKLGQIRWFKKLDLFTDEEQPDCLKRISITSFKSRFLMVHKLKEMGIDWFLQPDQEWTDESPQVIQFWKKGKQKGIARAIGLRVGGLSPVQYVGKVLKSVGYETESRRERGQGKRVRIYSLKVPDLISEAVYECVGTRMENYLHSDKSVLDWDLILKRETSSKNHTAQGLEVGHNPEDFLNKNSPLWDPQRTSPGENTGSALVSSSNQLQALAKRIIQAARAGADVLIDQLLEPLSSQYKSQLKSVLNDLDPGVCSLLVGLKTINFS